MLQNIWATKGAMKCPATGCYARSLENNLNPLHQKFMLRVMETNTVMRKRGHQDSEHPHKIPVPVDITLESECTCSKVKKGRIPPEYSSIAHLQSCIYKIWIQDGKAANTSKYGSRAVALISNLEFPKKLPTPVGLVVPHIRKEK